MNTNTTEYSQLIFKIGELESLVKQKDHNILELSEKLKYEHSILSYYGQMRNWPWYRYIQEGLTILWGSIIRTVKKAKKRF